MRVNSIENLFYGADTTNPIEVNINGNEFCFKGQYDKEAFYPLLCQYTDSKHDLAKTTPLLSTPKPKLLFDRKLNVKFENLPPKIGGFGNFEIMKYYFSTEKFKPNNTAFPALLPPFGNNLYEIINRNKELKEFIHQEFAKVSSEYAYDTELFLGKVLKENNGNKFILPMTSMADTLQRLIFYLAAIASNKNAVLVFGEPESYLFTPYISQLTYDIINDENNNQYFICTHNPFVLSDFMEKKSIKDELSIYAVGIHNGATTIKRITDDEMTEIYQYGIDLFFNLEDYLKNV